jgi:hypothetical protein
VEYVKVDYCDKTWGEILHPADYYQQVSDAIMKYGGYAGPSPSFLLRSLMLLSSPSFLRSLILLSLLLPPPFSYLTLFSSPSVPNSHRDPRKMLFSICEWGWESPSLISLLFPSFLHFLLSLLPPFSSSPKEDAIQYLRVGMGVSMGVGGTHGQHVEDHERYLAAMGAHAFYFGREFGVI